MLYQNKWVPCIRILHDSISRCRCGLPLVAVDEALEDCPYVFRPQFVSSETKPLQVRATHVTQDTQRAVMLGRQLAKFDAKRAKGVITVVKVLRL